MMRKLYSQEVCPGVFRRLPLLLYGLVALAVSGCDPDKSDGNIINERGETVLPTSTRLGLQCENVGIYTETCVLDDENNPFRTTEILEFDPNGPEDQVLKLDQFNQLIPADNPDEGIYYAKSKFYFWATALARFPSGENQFYTAVALHELYTVGGGADGGSLNAREQAIKAYRSVLDNFFGSVTFFSTCDFLYPSPPEPEFVYSVILSDMAGKNLVDPPGPTTFRDCDGEINDVLGLVTLFPEPTPVESEFKARQVLGQWGYSYVEVDEDTVFVTVSNFP